MAFTFLDEAQVEWAIAAVQANIMMVWCWLDKHTDASPAWELAEVMRPEHLN